MEVTDSDIRINGVDTFASEHWELPRAPAATTATQAAEGELQQQGLRA